MTSMLDSTPSGAAPPPPPAPPAGALPPVPPIAPPDADLGPSPTVPAPPTSAGDAPTPTRPATRTSSPPPAFPPPTPAAEPSAGRVRPTLKRWLVAIVALQLAAVFAVLWMANRGAADDARGERDAAIAERNAAEVAADDLQAQLDGAVVAADQAAADLAAAEADLAAAQLALDEVEIAGAESSAEADALLEQITVLDGRVSELTAERDQLRLDLEAAEAAVADAADAAEAAEAEAEGTTPGIVAGEFDIATTPEFARYLGEVLSDRPGGSVLGPSQAECFGTALVSDIGLDAVGAGQLAGSGSDAAVALDKAKDEAARACGIDPSAVR